jgi:hypothetical protein
MPGRREDEDEDHELDARGVFGEFVSEVGDLWLVSSCGICAGIVQYCTNATSISYSQWLVAALSSIALT